MSIWRRLFSFFQGSQPRNTREADLDRELRAHLELEAEEQREAGLPPDRARYAARRAFGNLTLTKEDMRAVWGWRWVEQLRQDARYTLRGMRRNPGFTVVAVLTLGLGLGVNTAIFSLISYLFLQPLPVQNAERLVVVLQQRANSEFSSGISWQDYQDYRAGIAEFSDMLALSYRPAHLSVAGRTPDRTWIEGVSPNYFSMLGVAPLTGRLFQPGEGEKRGADPIVVLGYDYWQTRLGGDPGIVGGTVVINGRAFTVVGITPRSFTSVQWAMAPSAFIPATMIPEIFPGSESILETRHSGAFKVRASLRPGVSEAQATSAVQVVAERLAQEYRPEEVDTRTFVLPEMLTRPEPSFSRFMPFAAMVFLVLAGFVLFIACANVANLMFSRTLARQREIGIRAAIGAPRGRLVRQLMTESIVLGVVAGVAGTFLSFGATHLLARLTPTTGDVPILADQRWDWLPLLYTLLVSVLAGALTGFVPAMRATRVDVNSILKSGAPIAGPARHLFRSGFVLAQVAVCVVVLVCGGLFVRSLLELSQFDLGFRTGRLLMASMDLGLQGYEPDRRRQFVDRLTEQVQAVPGVESAAVASSVPLDLYWETRTVIAAGEPTGLDPAREAPQAGVNRVDSGYFETMGITLLRGRGFSTQDRDSSPRVAAVNQILADRLWPGQEPLGKRFRWSSADDPIEVVGVTSNGKYFLLGEAPRPFVYLPLAQGPPAMVTLHIRSKGSDPLALAPSVRSVFRDLDPHLPIFNVRTMEEHLRTSAFAFRPLRMGAMLAGAQGVVALLLAMIGIYGVVAYSVRQQTRDIGIRRALGARNLDVFRLVSHSGFRPAIWGLAVGLAAAFGLARVLAQLLYGLDPMNAPVFVAVALLVLVVSLPACWLPARRATRVDPSDVLRCG